MAFIFPKILKASYITCIHWGYIFSTNIYLIIYRENIINKKKISFVFVKMNLFKIKRMFTFVF